ncbi:MAG: metallophosphoesterase [Clostridia bacterium]|nr:metallophosphoesterase [Clostridia bacterium]
MKILVMSDSHGRSDLVLKCILQHPDAEAVFFLGDVLIDMKGMDKRFPDRQFYCVRGNCDYDSDVPMERLVTLQGIPMLLTHGHAHGIKYGLDGLIRSAANQGAKIALFGHTHVPYNQYHDGIYLLNPGSLTRPRDCSRPSYGLIEITHRGILTNTADFNQFLGIG